MQGYFVVHSSAAWSMTCIAHREIVADRGDGTARVFQRTVFSIICVAASSLQILILVVFCCKTRLCCQSPNEEIPLRWLSPFSPQERHLVFLGGSSLFLDEKQDTWKINDIRYFFFFNTALESVF